MDTSACSLGNQNTTQASAQRKFYQWVLKWINGLNAHADTNSDELRDIRHSSKLDVPTIASFLQAIGFKLLSFEKQNDPITPQMNETNVSPAKQGVLKIAIECDISNMKAVLELGGITCQCPNPDHIKEASFWSISGTGPIGSTDNIAHKIEETGSNLLPRLSKDVTRVLRDVSYKLFDTITSEPDVNRNTELNLNISRTSTLSCDPKTTQDTVKKDVGVLRSHTQPEIRLRTNSVTSKSGSEKSKGNVNNDTFLSRNASPVQPAKPTLYRQRTWDIETETGSLDEEPRPSPPKLTSSPAFVAELSQSLGQISLESEIEHPKSVTNYIIGAQQNLEKALKVLLLKGPLISNELSPNQDNDCASVKSAPANISPSTVVTPSKTTRMSVVSNIKPVQKLSHFTYEQQIQTKTQLQTPKTRGTIEPTPSKSFTRRSMQLEQETAKPTVRRRSFYLPSSTNSRLSLLSKPSDTGQKFAASGKYSTSKTNLTIDIDRTNSFKELAGKKKTITPERQMVAGSRLETNNRASLIKPPSKISKSIPIKVKTVQTSKINTGMAKTPRVTLSKE